MFIYLHEQLLSALSRDEPEAFQNGSYRAILCVCTLVVCDSEWATVALHCALWISTKVVTMLFSWYMAGAKWNSCHLSACSVYTMQLCASLLHLTPHTWGACVFDCNLLPALLAERQGSSTCYCSNTGMEQILEIRVSTESWPWRKKILPGLDPETFHLWAQHSANELSPHLVYLHEKKTAVPFNELCLAV